MQKTKNTETTKIFFLINNSIERFLSISGFNYYKVNQKSDIVYCEVGSENHAFENIIISKNSTIFGRIIIPNYYLEEVEKLINEYFPNLQIIDFEGKKNLFFDKDSLIIIESILQEKAIEI